MHSEILFMLCTTIGLVRNFPVQVYDYVNPVTGDLEVIEILNDEDYMDFEHKQSKKSILDPCVQSQNGDVKCVFEDEARKAEFEKNLKFSMLPYGEENYGTIDESQWDYGKRRLDYDQNVHNSDMIAFEEMPFINPSPVNYNSDLSYSPSSSYGTYIHGLVPSQDAAQIFNSNIYQSQNMLPLNFRMARETSRYDDFLAQLAHDAMLNNILPTMPYVRNSVGLQRYQLPHGHAQAVASYPGAGVGSCAQPILLGCSPSIYQGRLASWSHSPAHSYFVQQVPYQYKTGHLPSNHKQGHDKVKPLAILPNQDYRRATGDLVSSKKI